MSARRRLVIGCGYLGKPLAASWLAAGDVVFTTTRSPERARQLEHEGFCPLTLDVTRPETLRQLPTVDTAVFCVGYDPQSGDDRDEVYAQGLQNVLDHLPVDVPRLIFVSTTGVYGDEGGREVDELTPVAPMRPGGRALLKAERLLRDHHQWFTKSVTLRMAGIYGPGRVPRAAEIRAGQPIPAPSGGALNLIHVEDAVQAVQLAAETVAFSPVYIVSDGHAVSRREYYREVARLIQAPEPTFEEPPPGSPAAERAQSNRRMSNRRLVEELSFKPKYPSYKEGLAAIL